MNGDKLKYFLIPQRTHERKMKEMTTKTEKWRQFKDMKDTDQISQILSWLKTHGYDVDPNAKFDKPDSKNYIYGKNVKIGGVNVQIYGVQGRPATAFRFMTRSRDMYHVGISNWATMYIGYHAYPDDPTSCIHKVDSFGPAEALECYIIPEVATEGAGAILGAICISILGVAGAVSSHNARVRNKKTRQEIETYLQEKGIDGSSDQAIKSYQDKLIADMTKMAADGIVKITSNKKFLVSSENIFKSNLAKVQNSMAEYCDDLSEKTWCKYSKGMLRFKPEICGMHHDAVTIIDRRCHFIDEIFDQEDNDDNAPGYADQVIGSICESVGTAVVKELESKFAEDIGIGLVSLEYCDMMNSPWWVPCIQLTAEKIPNRKGTYK